MKALAPLLEVKALNRKEANVKIGFTERGDAGRDISWIEKINEVDGLVLITKSMTDDFIKYAMIAAQKKPVIVHCTCTGYGGTKLEPGAFTTKDQLNQLYKLLKAGFPASQCVLRVDPIIPTTKGLKHAQTVLRMVSDKSCFDGITRVRISILDEYKHVKERFRKALGKTVYPGDDFQCMGNQVTEVYRILDQHSDRFVFETCAEPLLIDYAHKKKNDRFERIGCISEKDLNIMGLKAEDMTINPQNRSGCMCLSCKTELLTRKHQCENRCLYCYWK